MRAPFALPVSYGVVGPNWMRARLPQAFLFIILITLTQIRAGFWDLSKTHKGCGLLLAQLVFMKKKKYMYSHVQWDSKTRRAYDQQAFPTLKKC